MNMREVKQIVNEAFKRSRKADAKRAAKRR